MKTRPKSPFRHSLPFSPPPLPFCKFTWPAGSNSQCLSRMSFLQWVLICPKGDSSLLSLRTQNIPGDFISSQIHDGLVKQLTLLDTSQRQALSKFMSALPQGSTFQLYRVGGWGAGRRAEERRELHLGLAFISLAHLGCPYRSRVGRGQCYGRLQLIQICIFLTSKGSKKESSKGSSHSADSSLQSSVNYISLVAAGPPES